MRKLMSRVAAAALILVPAVALAQDAPQPEKEKPGILATVGATVGGVAASAAGTAAGGPLGGAAAGLAGNRVGRGVGGFVGKMFKRKKDEPAPVEVAQASEPPPHISSAPLDVPPVDAPAAEPAAIAPSAPIAPPD